MSTHFSANQYDQAFAAQRLQNWEIPQKFKERPSPLEGFTQPISNDRGHILPGIPRSSNSPWGEFVGTWDMSRPPLKTKTMKTNAMASNAQNADVAAATENGQKQEVITDKAKSPPAIQAAVRTPTPKGEANQDTTSPRPQSLENQCKKPLTPAKLKTPQLPPSPIKSPPIQDKAPEGPSELPDPS